MIFFCFVRVIEPPRDSSQARTNNAPVSPVLAGLGASRAIVIWPAKTTSVFRLGSAERGSF
jgi:hypothetical protein